MRLDLDVFGDRQVARDLLRFGDRASDARPAWNAILHRLAALERDQFDSEGGRASGGWAPLAPSTVADKARRNLDPRILHATGALRDSLTAQTQNGDAIRESHPDEMRFGTHVPYARFHQLGDGVPRRRPLELTETDRHSIFVQTVQRFLVTGDAPAL